MSEDNVALLGELLGDGDLEGAMELLGDDVPLMGARIPYKRRGAPLHYWPLGFPTVTFGAATGTSLPSASAPFVPFKGKRLIIDIARTGATATGLISISQLLVGQANQLPNAQPISAASFAPGAFQTRLDLAEAGSAIPVQLQLNISAAPAMTDVVVVQPTLLGVSRAVPR